MDNKNITKRIKKEVEKKFKEYDKKWDKFDKDTAEFDAGYLAGMGKVLKIIIDEYLEL